MTALSDIYCIYFPRNSDFKKFVVWYSTVPSTFVIVADTHWHLVPWYPPGVTDRYVFHTYVWYLSCYRALYITVVFYSVGYGNWYVSAFACVFVGSLTPLLTVRYHLLDWVTVPYGLVRVPIYICYYVAK